MAKPATFHDHYQQGFTPWDTHRVDQNLVHFITQSGLAPCSVLDAGCGTGHNCIWLAEQGFNVTGWDLVDHAIDRAKDNAEKAGMDCTFRQVDLLDALPLAKFDFIFDRGLFHCFKSTEQLAEIAKIMASLLSEKGTWLSLIGNADEPRTESGPPQLSAHEITTAVESVFRIDSITSSFFDSKTDPAPKNWVCHMHKR